MATVTLDAKVRKEKRKNQVKKLRSEGFIPCVIYGENNENELVVVKSNEYDKACHTEFKRNTILELNIDNSGKSEKKRVLTYGIQKDPISQQVLHLDFLPVTEDKKVQITVPVQFEGVSPGAKKGGVLIKKMDKLQIRVLPQNIPPVISVDISQLEVGEHITVKDIALDSIEVLSPESNSIVRVAAPRTALVDDEIAAEEAAEAEAAEGEAAEGDAPAEGAEAPAEEG